MRAGYEGRTFNGEKPIQCFSVDAPLNCSFMVLSRKESHVLLEKVWDKPPRKKINKMSLVGRIAIQYNFTADISNVVKKKKWRGIDLNSFNYVVF